MKEWDSIIKGEDWDSHIGNYTVICIDGKLNSKG